MMNVLTKNTILSIIAEQMLSVDEMSARPAELWQTEKLEQPMVIDLPGVTSLNPDTQTPEEGKVISNIIRISPKGQRLLQFKNLAKGGQRMWLEIGTDKVHPHLPRNDVYGTKWSGPKPLEDLYRDDEDKDKKIATRKENLTNEWPKRNLIFPIINSLFRSPNIIRQLDRCGIPEIVADNEYTEPVTNVRKIMLWTGPKLYFNFHAIRDEEDVQTALDKISRKIANKKDLAAFEKFRKMASKLVVAKGDTMNGKITDARMKLIENMKASPGNTDEANIYMLEGEIYDTDPAAAYNKALEKGFNTRRRPALDLEAYREQRQQIDLDNLPDPFK